MRVVNWRRCPVCVGELKENEIRRLDGAARLCDHHFRRWAVKTPEWWTVRGGDKAFRAKKAWELTNGRLNNVGVS